jgi:hypothetical protein
MTRPARGGTLNRCSVRYLLYRSVVPSQIATLRPLVVGIFFKKRGNRATSEILWFVPPKAMHATVSRESSSLLDLYLHLHLHLHLY